MAPNKTFVFKQHSLSTNNTFNLLYKTLVQLVILYYLCALWQSTKTFQVKLVIKPASHNILDFLICSRDCFIKIIFFKLTNKLFKHFGFGLVFNIQLAIGGFEMLFLINYVTITLLCRNSYTRQSESVSSLRGPLQVLWYQKQ